MDLFNFSFQSHDDLEDLRYSHSPASTPNLVEAPPDRVQSMHLSPRDHITEDETDPSMQTLDLLDEDDDNNSSSETELEPEMGAQKTTAICPAPMKSPHKPRSFLGGVTPAAYVSQCFNDANGNSKKSSKDVSPSSVYSRPQTLHQQQVYALPQTKYEIVAHNNHSSNSLRPALPIHAPSPLSQSFHPPSITSANPPLAKKATTVPETDSILTGGTSHMTNSYRLTPAANRWPTRKESLPSMLINTQSFMRYSNEHAPSPPSLQLQLQGLAKRRCSSPFLAPIDVKKSFQAGDCLTFGVTRKAAVRGSVGYDGTAGEKIVRVRVRRREGSLREVGRERSRIVIPALSTHSVSGCPGCKVDISDGGGGGETHGGQDFITWDFDDKVFFEELQREYARLISPLHLFSARSLRTIRPTCSTETESDSFSEEEMMRGFSKPGRGKGRYEWVKWVHRISPHPHPSSRKIRQKEVEEGAIPAPSPHPSSPLSSPANDITLDFIQDWSPPRLLTALTLVTLSSLSIALLWILLGTRTESNGVRISLDAGGMPEAKWAIAGDEVGYRHAGERVAGGLLAGILALMVGWMGICGWVIVSWVVE